MGKVVVERNRRDSLTYSATTPTFIWDASELEPLLASLPLYNEQHSKRERRLVREQRMQAHRERIITLRADDRTWDEIAGVIELSPSRVRAIYDKAVQASTAWRK